MKRILSIVLVLIMIFVLASCGEKKVDLASLTGPYYCEGADRAVMEVMLYGDEIVIRLQWASSAASSASWEMSGKYDNGKVAFSNMSYQEISFEESIDGDVIASSYNGTGVAEFKNETLTFVSCSDESLDGLVFKMDK